ncbi:hypothetical protein [Archangium sp.]|uniref:hypothetical protein n=1 Tax=Archangium sp. TaxID=1872627 RepID=UPI002869F255|nr:hypothetical protein [Archangium sp.]
MKFQARHLLPLCLLLLVTTTRCSCLTATTSSGQCEGRVGGVEVSGELDPESEHHTIYPDAGTTGETLTVLNLSCAKGKFKARGTMRRVTLIPPGPQRLPAEGGSTTCPPAGSDAGVPDAGTSDAGTSGSDAGTGGCVPTGSGSEVRNWEVLSDVHPKLISGLFEALLKLDTSLDGTVTMEFEDGSKVTIRFNAYHEDSLDVGEPPSSGGGGGSDFD